MKRLIPVFILLILFLSCRKNESDFIWEKSYGKGKAYFIKASPDSGFIACGESGGNPYFIRLNKKRSLILDLKSENQGLFSSAWFDTSGYVAGGNTGGKMLLIRYSSKGDKLWEKSLDADFKVDYTRLFYTGDGNFIALATASAASSNSGITGMMFVRFDTTGQIITQKKTTETSFVSSEKAVIDNNGNLFLALTRKTGNTKPKASVAKYNEQFQKLWETDLYNNPDFGAACYAIIRDKSGNIYVSGHTEVAAKDGNLNNSFITSLTGTGAINWKRYLENSNEGSALVFNDANELLMLNKNCFIVNIVNPSDGTDAGRIKTFSVCVSDNTDAFGADFDINYDKNILMAGSRGGSFYLALKSSQ